MISEPTRSGRDPDTGPASAAIGFDEFANRALYVVAFGLGAISATQIDLWWLLRAGKDIWHHGQVPLTDQYSHTADGRYWSNHEWLWEAIAYPLHEVGGMPLLSAWTGLTVALTLWLMRRTTTATGYVVPVVLGTSMLLLSISWTTRPQVTSMLLFALTVRLLVAERYAWIPLVFLVWANLHAQVVMGGVILAVALAVASIESVRRRTDASASRTRRLVLATSASAVATLITPLGPRLWTYVLSANGRPGQAQIAEWATAFHPLVSNFLFWALLAAAGLLVVPRPDRLRSWENRVPALATLAMAPLAALAVRNIPFFVVAAAPLLLTLLDSRGRRPVSTVTRWRPALVATAAAAGATVAAVWIAQPPKLAWRPVPPELAATLRACPGPLYNDYNTGAALIWWVPDVRVFADNRQDPYPADVIEASAGLDDHTYRRVFARYDIGCAYLVRSDPLRTLLQDAHWTATYEDSTSVVLVPPEPRATSATE